MINVEKVYFPNLNGLRFLAAFMVVIHHIEQVKKDMGLANNWDVDFFRYAGHLGVVLFFVLSGFLITYLLLAEKKATGRISKKDFYIRRALRIWPLYYFIILIGFSLLPSMSILHFTKFSDFIFIDFNAKITLFLLFLPNIALILFPPVPFVSQTWSVGVEEQFYLFWPLLIERTNSVLRTLLVVFCGYWLLRLLLILLSQTIMNDNFIIEKSKVFMASFSIDSMAIGGAFAFLFFMKKAQLLYFFYHKNTQLVIWLTTVSAIILGIHFPTPIFAVLFGIIILNLGTNPKTVVNLEFGVLRYLGKISYGIYMFHVLAIVITIRLLQSFEVYHNISVLLISVLLTVILSSVSYELMERKFIKMKLGYTKILSGDDVKPNL